MPDAEPTASAIVAPDFYNGEVKPSRSDIAVVGAGVAGLAMALRAASSGLRVSLIGRDVTQNPSVLTDWDLRVFAFSQASKKLFDDIGAWSELDHGRIASVKAMSVFANGGDSVPVDFNAADINESALAWIVEQANLIQALKARVAQSKIQLICAEVNDAQIDEEVVTLTLSDDSVHKARLLIGADGANSQTRALAGISHRREPYGQRALVCHVAVHRPHQSTAFQWFGDHGILALLPLPDQNGRHRMSMVWSCATETAEQHMSMGAEHTVSEMARIAGAQVGACAALTELAGFPLVQQVAQSLVTHRVALVGDAAHVVHPLAGQGLNLGLSDVATLGQLLDDARGRRSANRFDPGNLMLLRRYRRHRAEPLLAMQTAIDGIQRMFSHSGSGRRNRSLFDAIPGTVRELGWDFVARNAYIRRQIIRLAER